MFWITFLNSFKHYTIEIIPALVIGFFLSGIVHEFIPDAWIKKNLSNKGVKGVFYSTLIGTLIPVCCWGCLPIAVSFRNKGASLGPILAMLVATPATSVNALIVTARILGLKFAVYLFFSVIIMGLIIGLAGNRIKAKLVASDNDNCDCPNNSVSSLHSHRESFSKRLRSVLKFAFIEMPRDIGKETLVGLLLAALVSSAMPISALVKNYLAGFRGYIFAVIFGLLMYMCATMGVPLVDALLKQGLGAGAGFVLLLIGPITSYGTILVLRREFGMKVLFIYLGLICSIALVLGYIFTFI